MSSAVCPVPLSERNKCSSESLKERGFPSENFDPGFSKSADPNWHFIFSSSIPSTDSGGNSSDGKWWVGPSAHQLMRSLNRKGKSDGVTNEDAKVVAAIHTVITESTWAEIMEYEELHASVCSQPTLSRFEGKWNEATPKARLLEWLGYDKPFDRHDWYINRCGREVRYVIDYYGATQRHGFHIDARPAVTFEGVLDRAHVLLRRTCNRLGLPFFKRPENLSPFRAPPTVRSEPK